MHLFLTHVIEALCYNHFCSSGRWAILPRCIFKCLTREHSRVWNDSNVKFASVGQCNISAFPAALGLQGQTDILRPKRGFMWAFILARHRSSFKMVKYQLQATAQLLIAAFVQVQLNHFLHFYHSRWFSLEQHKYMLIYHSVHTC